MLNFDIFIANCTGSAINTFYSDKITVTDDGTLASAVCRDYVAAEYQNFQRSNDNFIRSNCVIMDCDNEHSDNPQDWKTPDDVQKVFTGVGFAVHYSRNHMKQKGDKSPRPKFHILFPIDEVSNAEQYSAMKRKVAQIFPYFDMNALDSARFFFGTVHPQVKVFNGQRNLTAFLDDYYALHPHTTTVATNTLNLTDNDDSNPANQSILIPQGTRNSTMLHEAVSLLKRHGNTSEVYIAFIEIAKSCQPPLNEAELHRIWDNALSYYKQEIATKDDYIAPEEFNAPEKQEHETLKPEDYSDLGQAKVFVREHKDKLLYSDATGFLFYNGSFWEDHNAKSKKLVQDFTDRQLEEVNVEIAKAQDALKNSNALDIVLRNGIKRAEGFMSTPAQKTALQQYVQASEYATFVQGRRKNSSIDAVVSSVMPQILFDPDKLNSDPFLLNTPSGTIDLRTAELKPHNPDDLITKQTAVLPDNENVQLWVDALNTFFCGDEELIRYVQEIVGLAAIGRVLVEAIIIAYGNGRNGKSTFWNTVARVLGNETYSGKISAAALTLGYRHNVKAELAELFGKRLIIASELEENMSLNTSVVKNLCSTDRIQAEKKFKAPFDFSPSHTLVLYTNHLPKIGTTDEGTWRRIILVPFNATIAETLDIKNYSDYLFDNAGGAILSWVIEGARRIICKDYRLDTPVIVQNAIRSYRNDNDWFANFLYECCEVDPSYSEQSGKVYNAYREYCLSENEHARRQKDFYKALDASFKRAKHSNKHMVVYGLRLRDTPLQVRS